VLTMRWVLAFFLLGVGAAMGQTPSAVILPNGFTQFSDANGKPLAGGSVWYYVPSTVTPKKTWQDPYESIANANPVVLNGSGSALIWGSGIYREVVKDVDGNLIWDQLSGGYNCTSASSIPMGANGALQYNNGGVFGGLALGTSSQVLIGNASGPPTWGSLPAGALPGGTTGTGAFVLQNSPTINTPTLNSPTIHTPTVDGGTWGGGTFNNPTFTGTVTMPGTSGYLLGTGATPTSGITSSQIAIGNSTSAAGFCGGYPYLGNDGCWIVNIGGNVAYLPYFH
jgi:hypothetical protein